MDPTEVSTDQPSKYDAATIAFNNFLGSYTKGKLENYYPTERDRYLAECTRNQQTNEVQDPRYT